MHAVVDLAASILEHFDGFDMPAVLLSTDEWVEFGTGTGTDPQHRFGWSAAAPGHFCPELIARQLGGRSRRDRADYVAAILYCVDRHLTIGLREPMLTAAERHRRVEDELVDLAPGSMRLMSEIELAALDT